MATVTKPILLDETGVAIKEQLEDIADAVGTSVAAEVARATAAEGVNAAAISAEETARTAADTAIRNDLTPTTKSAWETDNTPKDNTIYRLGTTAALTIAAAPTSNIMGVVVYFTSGATATTLSYPVGSKWTQATAPTIAANAEYMLSILDGVFNLVELSTLS